ncbi:S9 family peptidase [Arthrobacter agilis]|uniref:S9 family peptidase n=1 Tax=Arthrobacter agilis TaxID=37921 RepID=UPI000B34CC6D|nr:S9 family peptidase [Arthrobacter agilis]OUM44463.1 peptidase S9 [Arthrobacter agilis]PPB47366.1 S9 family peptidase [Arthrobacter agilis]TPV22844.1 S9 family peptidase [Arthrobacter agilis]VDR32096.1 Prolyl tripeptidyl peptidase precursor [Arthrobacter agilis]
MKPDQIELLTTTGAPTLHPDGSRLVVAATRPDLRADSYVGQLWELTLDGGRRRLTRGFRDTSPRFAPDGSLLVFLRAAPAGKPQLFAMRATGGEPVQLTDQPLGVAHFDISPDSSTVVFAARVPEHGRYGTIDGVGPGLEDPRLVTQYKYRMNGLGYTTDKRSQVFTVAIPDLDDEPFISPVGRMKETSVAGPGELEEQGAVPRATQVTAADADHLEPTFSADGQRILFTAALGEDADVTLVSDIHSIALDGGGHRQLTNQGGTTLLGCGSPRPSTDGTSVFFLASDLSASGLDFVARNTALYVLDLHDPTTVRRLSDPETVDFGDVQDLVAAGPDAVLAFNRTRGAGELLRISSTGETEVLVTGATVVTGADTAGDAVVVSYTGPSTSGDIAVVEDAGLRTLSDFSAGLRAETRVGEPQERTYPAPDGTPVHGWVVLPEGEGPHPVLLVIHGGPFAQYGWGYFDEAQVYAAAGYAVLLCNPRGAAGYGQAHGRVIKEAMGTVDLDDVLAYLDGAVAEFDAMDGDRLGVMGGSYGGYLTAWTIAHDHRFRAAIVERGYLDPPSFVGSSDIGWFFSEEYTGTDPAHVQAQNPFAKIGDVRTPAFVIHSEEDLRCPIEQAQRYYTALKKQGVETELLVFPGETHELSRSGSPWHRRQRFEHILRWWARYLPTAANPSDPSVR